MAFQQGNPNAGHNPTTYVYFDLETTGLNSPAITQIAAVGPPTMGDFARFVIPTKPIDAEASRITGISYENGEMSMRGTPVQAVPATDALRDFINYLAGNQHAVLVAHNAFRFDAPILVRTARSAGLFNSLDNAVVGVMDSLGVFREMIPGRGHNLQALISRYLGAETQTHEALDDAEKLMEIVRIANPPDRVMARHTRSLALV